MPESSPWVTLPGTALVPPDAAILFAPGGELVPPAPLPLDLRGEGRRA